MCASQYVKNELDIVRSRIQSYLKKAEDASKNFKSPNETWMYQGEINAYRRILDFIDEEIAMQEDE